MIRFKLNFLIVLFFIVVKNLKAQDANYWQSSYSPGGMLMPGAVIAYDNDSSLYYYNPALLAIKPKNSVSVSANLYDFHSINIKNGLGKNKDLKSTGFGINPLMASGTIAFQKGKTIALGYALIHDPVLSYQTTQRSDSKMQVLNDSYSPGNEYFVGQYAAQNKTRQTTAAGSIGVKLNDTWSIGLTGEGELRSQDFYEQYNVRAFINSPDTLTFSYPLTNVQSSYNVSYWHLGIRFKAGISYNLENHHAGLLISSPLISLKGRAILASDLVTSNLHLGGTNLIIDLLANGRQKSLPVKYKMPLSVAGSYAFDYGKGQMQLSGEYFMRINNYKIISPRNESFIRPDTGDANNNTTELLQFQESRKSVLNLAIGISYDLNEKIRSYISFRTDYNYAGNAGVNDEYNGYRPNTSTWNLYHCQVGANFKRRKVNLHAGLLLNYGHTSLFRQPLNFDTPDENNLLLGNITTAKGTYFSAGLLFAYIHNL